MNTLHDYLEIKPAVADALRQGRPVVALESTIISHGMPYPRNVETALQIEQIIREDGVEPATIAIGNGKLKVGLTKAEIIELGKACGVVKATRRDIPILVTKGKYGATTVAATMIIAAMAGISVFVTGGIGGVHRGAPQTFDISADLEELARTNVAVVCAGIKSMLDIGLTLEYLETKGVPVIGYQTDELPAFYTRQSGFNVDYRVDSVEELANALKTKWDLGLTGGVVVANPILEEDAMDPNLINQTILQALDEMNACGIAGKEATPFLLGKIKDLTGDASLVANIQLVYNNAKLGARLAKALVSAY